MIPTMELLAMTNTELNASLVEIKQLRQQQEEDRRRIAELEAQIAGQAQPPPFWPALSLPREDPRYGAPSGQTRID